MPHPSICHSKVPRCVVLRGVPCSTTHRAMAKSMQYCTMVTPWCASHVQTVHYHGTNLNMPLTMVTYHGNTTGSLPCTTVHLCTIPRYIVHHGYITMVRYRVVYCAWYTVCYLPIQPRVTPWYRYLTMVQILTCYYHGDIP